MGAFTRKHEAIVNVRKCVKRFDKIVPFVMLDVKKMRMVLPQQFVCPLCLRRHVFTSMNVCR